MSESTPEVSCETCVAACCKAPINMLLTSDEYKAHGRTMDLKLIVKPRVYPQEVPYEKAELGTMRLPAGFGLFELESGCANLTATNRCSIYATRPQCCGDFAVGSSACLRLRREAGLDADRPIDDEETARAVDTTEPLLREFFPTMLDAERASPSSLGPVAHVAPLDLAAVRQLIARETDWIASRLSECSRTAWSRRTRCAGWNVADVSAHLVTVQQFARRVLTAALEGHPAEAPPDFRGTPEATIKAFGRAAAEVNDALARITPDHVDRDVSMGDNESVSVRHLIEVLTMEVVVHGLDLADALGENRHMTTEAAGVIAHALPDLLDPGSSAPPNTSYVLRSLVFELPLTWRDNAVWSEPGVDPCCVEGEAEAVLLFALGRVPFDKSGLVTNQPDRARAFKRHFVGP
ncbi:MAG TPA: maleylpyruvate isomerase family mycothiol-dependent enzyme [Acidimicrobiia bacterium]|nr:maleylpyruvate isomerase family mycothiol-dependent enzyme [Acidimicrobiia bacterium]